MQYLEGNAIWKCLDDGLISKEVFDTALAPMRQAFVRSQPTLFLFQYNDSFCSVPSYLLDLLARHHAWHKVKAHVATDSKNEPKAYYPHLPTC